LLRLNERPLSELMRPLNSKYAQWFRKKSKSTGYVFQKWIVIHGAVTHA
jgi:hypothetical protein